MSLINKGDSWKNYFLAGYISAIFTQDSDNDRISRLENKIKHIKERVKDVEGRCEAIESNNTRENYTSDEDENAC